MTIVRHQQQPNRASCFFTSLGMMFGVDVQNLFDIVGHDGTEKIWPDQAEPFCFRGHTIDEAMWCSLILDLPMRLINRDSIVGHTEVDIQKVKTPYHWEGILNFNLGKPKVFLNDHHAVCWHDYVTYDPSRLHPSRSPIVLKDWEICIL
jgi:hypothetical protein